MIRLWVCAFAVLSGALASCGGGGGTTNSPAASSDIQLYTGHFSSPCERVDEAVNLDLGGSVFAQTYSSVTPISAKAGGFSFRIDFFADSQCQTAFLGALVNENPANRITIVGVVNASGVSADKVVLSIFPPAASAVAGGTPGMVVYGSTVRLALPAFLFQNWQLSDLWRLEGGRLLEGGLEEGADGFPISLDLTTGSDRVAAVPALPAQPCASQTKQWTGSRGTCSAQLAAGVSSSQQWLRDELGPTTGSAGFTCSNGVWSEQIAATCFDSTPVPPDCPAQTLTWTVDGNLCSGTIPDGYLNQIQTADNVTAGVMGIKQMRCVNSQGASAGALWSEFIFPVELPGAKNEVCTAVVVQPPVTDPLQILKNKNCMLCHSVTNAESAWLSFETIAAFYRNNPPAPGVLEAKIKSGGIGVFLDLPMPANPQISDDELAIVVPWILSR
jgi:cytochrome c